MNIYLIMMEITPSKDNDVDDCVGAYANCFVKAPSIDRRTKMDSEKRGRNCFGIARRICR